MNCIDVVLNKFEIVIVCLLQNSPLKVNLAYSECHN